MKKIVVIGASAASVSFMTKLRSFDKESQVVCFSGEASVPYNRCLLADFLTEELSTEQLHLKPEQFFVQQNIQLFLNSWVIKLDLKAKQVLVQSVDGQIWHDYDYLFLGMGTKPFIPLCLQNISAPGLFTFHTLDDMQKIQKYIQTTQSRTAVVIGAGLNGIEAVSALLEPPPATTAVE
jgi:ferredoxin-nitrate reductase